MTEKLKEKEAAHTLIVADLQAAANASKGYRLEVIRLQEEVDRLRIPAYLNLMNTKTLKMKTEPEAS